MIEQNKRVIEQVHVYCAGQFANAVAGYLVRLRSDIAVTRDPGAASPDYLPGARINIVASSRPMPDLCVRLSAASADDGRPFLPLFTDGARLQLGPVILPERGACWSCWSARFKQHDSWSRRRSALSEYYLQHPGAGPSGYLECFAMIGAARLSQIVDAIDAKDDLGGCIWEMDMMTRESVTSRVVGVHDCPRCGLRRPLETRSTSELQERLAYLWA